MKKIAFLLENNNPAGGTFVVYRHAKYLKEQGFDVSLVFVNYEVSNESLFYIDKEINIIKSLGESKFIHFDLAIATWWVTAFRILNIDSKKYAYFVQSDERKFYDEANKEIDKYNRYMVEWTYKHFPGHIITEAKWIVELFKKEFNKKISYSPNGIDTNMFNENISPLEELPSNKLRILVEGPGDVSFKRVEFSHMCLAPFYDKIEIWHIANDGITRPYWKIDKLFSNVPYKEMPKIMASCDLIIKLSVVEGFFGPPLEMFALGQTALTSNVTGFDEYIESNKNAFVVPMDDYNKTVNQLREIINLGRNGLAEYKSNALNTAKKLDWNKQHPYFIDAINVALEDSSSYDYELFHCMGLGYLENAISFLEVYKNSVNKIGMNHHE